MTLHAGMQGRDQISILASLVKHDEADGEKAEHIIIKETVYKLQSHYTIYNVHQHGRASILKKH